MCVSLFKLVYDKDCVCQLAAIAPSWMHKANVFAQHGLNDANRKLLHIGVVAETFPDLMISTPYSAPAC